MEARLKRLGQALHGTGFIPSNLKKMSLYEIDLNFSINFRNHQLFFLDFFKTLLIYYKLEISNHLKDTLKIPQNENKKDISI